MGTYVSSAALPLHVLERSDVQDALARHDFGRPFFLARKWGGISYSRIADAVQVKPERVGKLARGEGSIASYRKITDIADGLRVPGHLVGLAPRPWEGVPSSATSTDGGEPTDGGEVRRGEFLRAAGAAVVGVGLDTGARNASAGWRTSPGASGGPGRSGGSDLADIERAVVALRALDQQVGGDRLEDRAGRVIADAAGLLHGSNGHAVEVRLNRAFGEACVLAGWLAQDAHRLNKARRLYCDAIATARLAQDQLLAAHAYANLALLHTGSGQLLRAVQYARAGQRAAIQGGGGPRTRALLFAREAAGCAYLGDGRGTGEAARKARQAYESTQGRDCEWVAFLSDAELAGILGDAEVRIGRVAEGLGQLSQASQMAGHPRNSTSWRVALAHSHARSGDPGKAAALAVDVLPVLGTMSSTRVRTRFVRLVAALSPYSRIPEVSDLREGAVALGILS